MPITTISSRELNQDISRAKRAAQNGPVFITERGSPAYVLLSIEAYHRLTKTSKSLIDRLSSVDVSDIDLDSVLDRPRDKPKIIEFD